MKVGQHLFTRDGRKFGNAIVTAVDDQGRCQFESDFGNGSSWLTQSEIDQFWFTEKDGEPQISELARWREDRANAIQRTYHVPD